MKSCNKKCLVLILMYMSLLCQLSRFLKLFLKTFLWLKLFVSLFFFFCIIKTVFPSRGAISIRVRFAQSQCILPLRDPRTKFSDVCQTINYDTPNEYHDKLNLNLKLTRSIILFRFGILKVHCVWFFSIICVNSSFFMLIFRYNWHL